VAYINSLLRENLVYDYAQSLGAALAFYATFSIAPLLLIVSSIAGLVFGEGAVRAEIFYQLQSMLGTPGAFAVQGLLESARKPTRSVLAVVVGIGFQLMVSQTFSAGLDALSRWWHPRFDGWTTVACTFDVTVGIVLSSLRLLPANSRSECTSGEMG
jgi:uncharacterized BrkB/YihY/UPF0761 family membrane protein